MNKIIGVIGAGNCEEKTAQIAEEVGGRLATSGCVVITGGLGGVMAAASRGAMNAGGTVVGILPGDSVADANPWVTIPVATGMGDARNAIICNTAEAFVAISGGHGTLSEIAFALKRGKPVVVLDSWESDLEVITATTPEEAVRVIMENLSSP